MDRQTRIEAKLDQALEDLAEVKKLLKEQNERVRKCEVAQAVSRERWQGHLETHIRLARDVEAADRKNTYTSIIGSAIATLLAVFGLNR